MFHKTCQQVTGLYAQGQKQKKTKKEKPPCLYCPHKHNTHVCLLSLNQRAKPHRIPTVVRHGGNHRKRRGKGDGRDVSTKPDHGPHKKQLSHHQCAGMLHATKMHGEEGGVCVKGSPQARRHRWGYMSLSHKNGNVTHAFFLLHNKAHLSVRLSMSSMPTTTTSPYFPMVSHYHPQRVTAHGPTSVCPVPPHPCPSWGSGWFLLVLFYMEGTVVVCSRHAHVLLPM